MLTRSLLIAACFAAFDAAVQIPKGALAFWLSASNIPGHPNASFTVVKETSSNLIEAFEGTYSTTAPETGTFNIILSRTLALWGGMARKTGGTSSSSVDGTISGNNLIDPANNNRVTATLSSDNLSGSFVDNNGKTVTLTGHRTL